MKKVCIVCGEELPIEQFPENRRMPDGHLGWCFECFALRTWRPKQHRIEPVAEEPTPEEHPAPVEPPKPKAIRRYKRSEEAKERNRIRARQYYYEHRDRCIANQKRYRQTEQGRQRKAEHMRAYRKTEKYKAWLKARNARRREAYAQKRLERQ